jgi:hypothetical protein
MMNSKQFPVVAKLLIVGALLSAPSVPALAADTAPPSVNAVPATDATWKAIDSNVQKLDALIRAGSIGDLGQAAYAIANSVETLPKKSAALPPEQLAQVTASVKTVGSLATKVDKAGDSNDKAGVESTFKSLKDGLAALRAIYFKPASK